MDTERFVRPSLVYIASRPPTSPPAWKTQERSEERTHDADFFFFFVVKYTIVIPDYAKMTWSVRTDAWGALEPLRDRVVNCFECVENQHNQIITREPLSLSMVFITGRGQTPRDVAIKSRKANATSICGRIPSSVRPAFLLYCVKYGAVGEFSTVATIPGHFDTGALFC